MALVLLAKLPGTRIEAVIMTNTGLGSAAAGTTNVYRLLDLLCTVYTKDN